MQIAATVSDTIIRKMEKLYNFSGFIVLKEIIVPTVCAVLFPFKKIEYSLSIQNTMLSQQ